jgi:6-phosphogluconolactonase
MKAPGTVRRFADLDALSRAAADDFSAIVRAAVAARGTCSVALSGGSTPERLFKLLAQAGRDALPWDHVTVWWGDERTVAPDHPDSNYAMARRSLLDPLAIDAAAVHRMAGERADHDAAARDYERDLIAALGAPPVFDLVLLGMGPDGHTASLFPGTPALDETARWVVANPVDSPVTHGATVRLTLTAPAINAARHVRFLIGGKDKADSLAHVLDGAREPRRFPSQLIAPPHGDLVWMIADDAAQKLGAPA